MVTPDGIQRAKLIDISKITGAPSFFLSKAVVKVGRASTNDFVIRKKTVSGRHAIIEQKQDGYFLTDLNSTSGTRVNGVAIDPNVPHKLEDGDVIYFDRFSFVIKLEKTAPVQATRIYGETIDIGSKPLTPDREDKEAAPVQPGGVYVEMIDIDSRPLDIDKDITEDKTAAPDTTERSRIGNYETIKLLGQGGFGSVWKAKDSKGKLVAVKLLNPEALENERAVRKFFHEAIILSKMDHPNICRFIDFFPHNQNFAIVMDFVQGTDLKTILKEQKGPLPFEMACRIAEQTLDAFQYAHQQQVLHRDIKPGNIILDEEGTVRIMDFGIAKLSSSETQHTSATMISPGYTAPERFDVRNIVDHRSDIYSLGIFFYEIFTGRHPYQETSPVEMISAHLNASPGSPDEFTNLPKEISRAILKALEKMPDDRFQDFAAFKASMLGNKTQAPVVSSSLPGSIEFSGEYYRYGGALLKKYSDIILKYNAAARKFSIVQNGSQLELTIKTAEGGPIRVTKDLKMVMEDGK